MRNIRKALAKLSANPAELLKHAPQLCRVEAGTLGELRADGVALTAARRDELLARCAANEYVELEVDLLAYEQKTGERNRNSVRFRDGAMLSIGRTGKGAPFLRDHNQSNSLSKAGVIVASATEKRGDGEYAIRQTVKLTAPWAVDMALRGLMDTVSIGWRPTGPVLCSACNSAVYTKCYHWPGDRLVETDDGAGGKKRTRAADGPVVVEWIYTEAELVETSVVNVPGVPNARIDDVRAAMFASLSAGNPALRAEVERSGFDITQENDMDPELLKLLGLSETATEDEVKAAVAKLKESAKEGAVKGTELAITQKDFVAVQAKLAAIEADQRKAAEDKFIADALASGRIGKGDEEQWRALHAHDPKHAVTLMAKREPASATPVGAARQSAVDPDRQGAPVITGGARKLHLALTAEDQASQEREKVFAELMSNPRALHYAAKLWGLRGDGIPTVLGATTIANNADLDAARVGFHAAFLTSLEQKADDPTAELYTTVPSNGNLEEWNWLGDLPGFEEWKGERKLAGLEGFKLRVSNKDWSSGLRVKANDFKDDKLGLLPPQVAALAMKARRHRWDMMVKLLANGFAGNVYPEVGTGLGYDGAFFFSDAHATGSNKLTSALDATALSAAELKLESMTTYDGADPMDIHGTHLIVGPKLRATAEKLLTQERLASGEDNYHRGKHKLIVSQRLRGTADDYWFLADLSSAIKPLLFQMREEISTSSQIAPDSEGVFSRNEYRFGAQARYNVAYFEHRLVVGSLVA